MKTQNSIYYFNMEFAVQEQSGIAWLAYNSDRVHLFSNKCVLYSSLKYSVFKFKVLLLFELYVKAMRVGGTYS